MSNDLNSNEIYLCPDAKSLNNEINISEASYYESVVAQQDHICGIIGAPTTIIQFRRSKCGYWERIDSQVSGISLRTSCDILRRCVKDDCLYCSECDYLHADLFNGLSAVDFEESLKVKINSNIHHIRKRFNNPNHNIHIETYLDVECNKKRCFIYYDCPLFGYRELAFPIFFENQVIAVFILGQIKLKGTSKIIQKTKRKFFENNPDIFNQYIELLKNKKANNSYSIFNKVTEKSIIKYVLMKSIREVKPYYPDVFNKPNGVVIPFISDEVSTTSYNSTISKICDWLYMFEYVIKNDMMQKREVFVNRLLDNELSLFHESLYTNSDSASVATLWNNVKRFFDSILDKCALESIIVYSSDSVYHKKVKELVVVVHSGASTLKQSKFSIFDTRYTSPVNSKTNADLFNSIANHKIQNDLCTIVYHPMKEISAASVAILIQYKNINIKNPVESSMITNLMNLSAFISAKLSIVFENVVQARLEKTLRLYKHEMVTLSKSLHKAVKILGSPSLKETEDYKLLAIHKDAVSSIELFKFMSEIIGILLDENKKLKYEKQEFNFYNKLLYKWENVHRSDAHLKTCEFVYTKSAAKLHSDARLVELVVYNLISNAIKYAYNGTKIYLNYNEEEKKLSVTNFAFNISENDQKMIYDLGFRAEKAENYYPEGTGIGLWICKRIIKLLGGSIRLCPPKCTHEEYNIPLLHSLKDNPKKYKDVLSDTEYKKAVDAYTNIQKEIHLADSGEEIDVITWIVTEYRWKSLPKRQLKRELKTPIYEIRFEVLF